jgi:signal transduction histidine kinase
VRPIASAAGTALELEGGAPETSEWRGDGARLVRACENLLRNAVRHARSRVSFALELHAGALRFRVRDDGSGFGGAPGPVDLRAARVIGMDVGTSGLGLLVVERIAVAHGGRLGATNLEGGGAEVWFEIAGQPPAGRARGQW